jgi:hypothetical protein
MLLICVSLGTVGVALDRTCLLGVRRTVTCGLFLDTTRTRRRMEPWSLGETWIQTF